MELDADCKTAATSLAIDWSKLEKLSLDEESEVLTPPSVNERNADEYFPPMEELLSLPDPSPLIAPPLPPPGPIVAPDCLKALYMDFNRKCTSCSTRLDGR